MQLLEQAELHGAVSSDGLMRFKASKQKGKESTRGGGGLISLLAQEQTLP